MKILVTRSAAACKESAGRLNSATLDRVTNAVTYRVYGQDGNINRLYEENLGDYEKKAAIANLWETSMQPLYQIISMMSVIFILWFGSKNVTGTGGRHGTSRHLQLSSLFFTKLAVKSSKAAKLFNAVQKAEVSWKRIKPCMTMYGETAAGSLKNQADADNRKKDADNGKADAGSRRADAGSGQADAGKRADGCKEQAGGRRSGK